MRKIFVLLLSLVIIVLVGCSLFEEKETITKRVDVKIIDKWIEKERISGDCYVIGDGTTNVTYCDPDKEQIHYNVKVQYDGKVEVIDNSELYSLKKDQFVGLYHKVIGKETGKIHNEYLSGW